MTVSFWGRSLGSALAVSLLAASAPAFAQDSDGDGITDAADAFPCDETAAAEAFAPALGAHGMLLFEDQWPSMGDLDFNDLALAYNYQFQLLADGRVQRLRVILEPLAIGGTFDNGLGLHLPIPASAVQSVTRRTEGGAVTTLSLQGDEELTVVVSQNLRELFANTAGPINSAPDTARRNAQALVVEIELATPLSLAFAAAPYDVFIFRSADPTHQIHRPEFAGTANMNQALFGARDDASRPGRWFVDRDGLPFALDLPGPVTYPAETTAIENLYPDIVTFAASGGAEGADFYTRPVAEFAYADVQDRGPLAPRMPFGQRYPAQVSCLPPAGSHVFDDFNRADSTTLGVPSNGEGAWQQVEGTLGTTTQRAGLAAAGAKRAVVDSGTPNVDVSASIWATSYSCTNNLALYVRYVNATNWLRARVALVSSSTYVYLERSTNGTVTLLGSTSVGYQAIPSALRIRASGSDVELLHNGNVVLTRTETAHESATLHGIGHSAATSCAAFDDYSARSLPLDAPPEPSWTGFIDDTTTSVTISWEPSHAVDVDHYVVTRNGNRIGTAPRGTTSFTESGLTPATTYVYRVFAIDRYRNEGPASVEITTRTAATAPIAISDDFNRDNADQFGLVPAGNAAWQEVGRQGAIRSQRAQRLTGSPVEVVDASTPDVNITASVWGSYSCANGSALYLRYRDASNWLRVRYGLSGSSGYIYLERAVNGAVAGRGSASIGYQTAPAGLQIRSSGSDVEVLNNGNVVITSVETEHLTATRHGFGLPATTCGGIDSFSLVPSSEDLPAAPLWVTHIDGSSSSLTISWLASNSVDVDHYVVHRNGLIAGTVPRGTTTFSESGLAASSLHSYQIETVDRYGNHGPLSPAVAARTASPAEIAVLDDFNRENGDLGLTSSGNATWQEVTRSAGVRTNRAQGLGGNAIAVVDTSAADVDISASLWGSYSCANGSSLYLRYTDGGNWLRVRYGLNGSSGYIYLERNRAGAVATLATSSIGYQTTAAGLQIRASGRDVEILNNGQVVASYTDNDFFTATRHGLGTPATTCGGLDDFAVTPLAQLTPPPPVWLTVVNASASSNELSWIRANAVDVDHYLVYRDGVLIATLPSTARGYVDGGLASSTSHRYHVVAVDRYGNSSETSVSTIGFTASVTPIEVWDDFNRANADQLGIATSANAAWQEVTRNVAIRTNRAQTLSGAPVALIDTATPDVIVTGDLWGSYSCANGSELYLRFRDVNNWLRVRYGLNGSSGYIYLERATNGTVTTLGTSSIGYQTVAADLTIRASGSDVQVLNAGEVVLSTTDALLTGVTRHGFGSPSTTCGGLDDFRALPLEQEVPPAPRWVTVTGVTVSSIDLFWLTSNAVDVAQYLVLRDGMVIATLPGTQLRYTDAGLTAQSTHSYQLQAIDRYGNYGPLSNPVVGMTASPAPIAVTDDFNRANADALGVTSSGNASWQEVGRNVAIRTSRAQTLSGGPVALVETTSPDVVITGDLWGSYSCANGTALYLRYRDASNWLRVRYGLNGSSGYLYLERALNGAVTTLGTSSVGYQTVAAGLHIRASLGEVQVLHNGNVVLSTTDTNHNTATRHGFGSPSTTCGGLDDFSVVPVEQVAPPAPSWITVVGATQSTIELSWLNANDVDLDLYRVYRDGNLIATLPASTLRYTDSGLETLTAYSYDVEAIDRAGNVGARSTAVLGMTTSATRITVSDSFDRANGELGITSSGNAAWQELTRSAGVRSNRAQSLAGSPVLMIDNASTAVEISATLWGTYTCANGSALYVRYADASNWLRVRYGLSGSSGYLYFERATNGAVASLGTSSVGYQTVPSGLRIRASGTTVEVLNPAGTVVLTAQDTALGAITRHGIGLPATTCGGLDNFLAAPL